MSKGGGENVSYLLDKRLDFVFLLEEAMAERTGRVVSLLQFLNVTIEHSLRSKKISLVLIRILTKTHE